MLAPGLIIGGRYRLVRQLGAGGMGVVWSAINEAFGREVAVKVMIKEVAVQEPTAVDRFFNEARICGAIRHPGIVDVIDVGQTDDGSPFLVMELLEGEPLDGVIRRLGTMAPAEILPIVRDVARTLELAHQKGVIHRDIKPGNIFLHRLPTGQMVAKVLDFGISKMTPKGQESRQTQTGTVVGSPAYMSPEHAGGRLFLDARTDLYALGVVLYEALSGRLPFQGDNYNSLIIDIAVREPPTLAEVAPSLPKAVHDAVAFAMVRDREKRVQTAAQLADRLEAAMAAIGVPKSAAVPDPAKLGGGLAAPNAAGDTSARTSYGLTTSARARQKKTSPLVGVGIGAAVLLLVGVIVGMRFLKSDGTTGTNGVGPAPDAKSASVTAGTASNKATAAPTAEASASAPIVTAAPAASESAPPMASAAPSASSNAGGVKPGKGQGSGKKPGVWGYE